MIKRKDIQYRVGTFKSEGDRSYATFLIYIDARTCASELDEKYGQLNWKFDWHKVEGEQWAVKGTLAVYNPSTMSWIEFNDVGYPNDSKTDSEDAGQWLKDAVSDALKRCGVQAGIGRELYDAPLLYTEDVITRDYNGKKYFKKLGTIGQKEIEGRIDQWYAKLNNKD